MIHTADQLRTNEFRLRTEQEIHELKQELRDIKEVVEVLRSSDNPFPWEAEDEY